MWVTSKVNHRGTYKGASTALRTSFGPVHGRPGARPAPFHTADEKPFVFPTPTVRYRYYSQGTASIYQLRYEVRDDINLCTRDRELNTRRNRRLHTRALSIRSSTTRCSTITLLLAIVSALAPGRASAHLDLQNPPSRYGPGVLKEGPCGRTGGERSDNVTVYRPGQTIEVVISEYIDHPGHYRIAFDPDGDDDLADPACLSGCNTSTPVIERNTPGVMVLMDGIEDREVRGGDDIYRIPVTLPNIECDRCTLQVIQVMYDKPPQTRPGNDIYYQCADLVLSYDADPGPLPRPDGGSPTVPAEDGGAGSNPAVGGTCGCRAAPRSAAPGAVTVLLLGTSFACRRPCRRGRDGGRGASRGRREARATPTARRRARRNEPGSVEDASISPPRRPPPARGS